VTIAKTAPVLGELSWRGLLHQATAPAAELDAYLTTPGRVAYCGFDPTSDSLTQGNFVALKLLMHWQRAGHTPIVVMGGGTGLIGDPSGKDAERQLLNRKQIEANVAGQRRVCERLLDFDPKRPNHAILVNNVDWLDKLGYIEVLRDVGKHFSVNAMIQKDSVRARLEQREQGISYTEFSYVILQAYDFLHLRRTLNCTVQMAGSDQYGNIVAGIDLIRRQLGSGPDGRVEAYGITAPLLTRADGKKIGKTEQGSIWLSAERTSPYAFYQYWVNVEDGDVISFLKWFTFLNADTIAEIEAQHGKAPHERAAQRRLAGELTSLVHGEAERMRVEAASRALFDGDVRSLDAATIAEVFADVPHSTHASSLLAGDGASLVDLLPQTSLAASKREAREFLAKGAVAVNGERAAPDRKLTTADLLHGARILLRRGKRNWHATEWQ
jgi:tyrosyl-tRNA synthetase